MHHLFTLLVLLLLLFSLNAQNTLAKFEMIPPPHIEIDCSVNLNDLGRTGSPLLTDQTLVKELTYQDKKIVSDNCGEKKILRTFRCTTSENRIIKAQQIISVVADHSNITFPRDYCTQEKMTINELSPNSAATSCSLPTTISTCEQIEFNHDDRIQYTDKDILIYRTWKAFSTCDGRLITSHTQVLQAKYGEREFGYSNKSLRSKLTNEFVLRQNRPNPARGNTIISFVLPHDGMARLTITNEMGQRVLTQENYFVKGENSIALDIITLPAGIYIYTLTTEDNIASRQMIIVR